MRVRFRVLKQLSASLLLNGSNGSICAGRTSQGGSWSRSGQEGPFNAGQQIVNNLRLRYCVFERVNSTAEAPASAK